MGQTLKLGILLFYVCLYGICEGFSQECVDYKRQFDRAFSVPGDMVMLNSTLVSPSVFNFSGVPYNVTWYNIRTGQEISNQTGRILVLRETLWFLRIALDDDGEYKTILRTPFQCYMQTTKLEVNMSVAGECARPLKVEQMLTHGVNDHLSCPLRDYISKLDSYNISSSILWYKGCEPIVEGTGKYVYRDKTSLIIKAVDHKDNDTYTCTLTATLGGVTVHVSETIDPTVIVSYSMAPQVREPTNGTFKAPIGSRFSKLCRVFVPGVGLPFVDIFWSADHTYIKSTDPSDPVYTTVPPLKYQDSPDTGVLFELLLTFSELREEDFNINYTCQAQSGRGHPQAYFTLLQADPDIMVPIGSVFGCVMFLFISCVIIYYFFKIDIVLWFRRMFPVLYADKESDGKLYDAYVAYPRASDIGFSKAVGEVESFALHTMPEILEKACGYKLFIPGRNCVPGEAMVDSVEENIQASRRLLLLYTASTFAGKGHTGSTSSSGNNNNLSKNNNSEDRGESKSQEGSNSMDDDGADGVPSNTRQWLECLAAMHRALLEGSLKVVLVELEEVTEAQLALFPESVRHLRKKQGAVCLWSRQRRVTCARRCQEVEKGGQGLQLSLSFSPSSRFWKGIRYCMPVRGKGATYPEKTALLHL